MLPLRRMPIRIVDSGSKRGFMMKRLIFIDVMPNSIWFLMKLISFRFLTIKYTIFSNRNDKSTN